MRRQSIFLVGLASIRASSTVRSLPVAFSKSTNHLPLHRRTHSQQSEQGGRIPPPSAPASSPVISTRSATAPIDTSLRAFTSSSTSTTPGDQSSNSMCNNNNNNNNNIDDETYNAEVTRKIKSLSDKSREFHELGLEERLELLNGILANIEALGDDKLVQNDMAVFQLGPRPTSGGDGDGNGGSDYKCTSAVNKVMGFNKFFLPYFVVLSLKNIKKHLKYQIMLEQKAKGEEDDSNININISKVKTPALLQRVRDEEIGGKKFRIHGPVEAWPLFHKIEMWADPETSPSPPSSSSSSSSSHHQSSSTASRDKTDTGNEDTNSNDEEGICVVLPGGNQSVVTFADTLQCLFYHPRRPVLIKHHPLRPHLYDTCAKIFAPLIEAGYVDQVFDNGLSHNVKILQNPLVQHVHVTGAYSTALAIEKTLGESRPHKSKQEIQDMVTSELGCATPWIFVPGKYTHRELRMAAKHIVTSKKINAGCNCVCGQVVILPQQWEQKDEFRSILLRMFEEIPTDPLYYPGSKDKILDIVSQYKAEKVTQVSSDRVERKVDGFDTTMADDQDYVQPYIVECGTYGQDGYNDFALKNEAFGPMLAIMELPDTNEQCNDEQIANKDSSSYLCDSVVPFVNDKENIFGSLSCSIVFPKRYDDRVLREAAAKLNYGSIGFNTWTSYGYGAVPHGGTWGGSIHELSGQSGRGCIGNCFGIPNVVKTLVWSRSLTFPLIVDKTFLPPKFVAELGASAFLRWGKFGLKKSNTDGGD